MGPDKRRDKRTTDTRERIEEVALELWATQGFTATSLRDIAQALGVTKAALYYHFPSKAELARAVFQPFMDATDRLLDELEEGDPTPREVLEGYFDAMVPFRRHFLALLRDASVLAHVDLEEATLRWVERFQDLLVGPNPTPAERVRALVAVGGLGRTLILTDLPVAELRPAAVEAALGALNAEAPVTPTGS